MLRPMSPILVLNEFPFNVELVISVIRPIIRLKPTQIVGKDTQTTQILGKDTKTAVGGYDGHGGYT